MNFLKNPERADEKTEEIILKWLDALTPIVITIWWVVVIVWLIIKEPIKLTLWKYPYDGKKKQ